MKVGDYVRTKDGIIFKWNKLCTIDKKDYEEHTRKILFVENEIKSSPNIIDLIEVGDIVNYGLFGGGMVIIKTDGEITTNNILFSNLKEKDIKKIITKEQIENMEYEIGE